MQIESKLDVKSDIFKENKEFHLALANELKTKLEKAYMGGGEKSKSRLEKQGKLDVRLRVNKLIDTGSEFLELSELAGHELYDTDVASGGIVTGVGVVAGRACMIVANDPSVKGGTYFPITVKKHLRAQEIAERNHLPCIYLVDSGELFFLFSQRFFQIKMTWKNSL